LSKVQNSTRSTRKNTKKTEEKKAKTRSKKEIVPLKRKNQIGLTEEKTPIQPIGDWLGGRVVDIKRRLKFNGGGEKGTRTPHTEKRGVRHS